ncbi:MAG: GSU2403 family nucleotidyltransferase fold protein [Stellaceae bacterium]
MASNIPLALQTVYAELLDRCAAAAFGDAFSEEDGVFTPKTLRGRRYWYFQLRTETGRRQRYVGVETPELLERIARHREARDDQRDRRALVSTLVRSAHLPRPSPEIGDVVAALSKVGVFRLRGVLVGTVAYQTYSAMLGTRLPAAALRTEDIDVAQFANVSVAVEDRTPAMLDVLREVDRSFRPVPHLHDARRVTTYEAANGIRVDFLTPNKGPESDAPAALPALGTDAQRLRFLDFLIHDPEPAVILHGAGVYALVPSPPRYAVHKLIVARRRGAGSGKRDKDVGQAEALLDALAEKRGGELASAWQEAYGRGKSWRRLLGEGLGLVRPDIRDRTLKSVGAPRSIVPGLDMRFAASSARYDFDRDVVTFFGEAAGTTVRCAVSREALEDHFGADDLDKAGRLRTFHDNRQAIEQLARAKYLSWPVEEIGSVLLRSGDIPELRPAGAEKAQASRSRRKKTDRAAP